MSEEHGKVEDEVKPESESSTQITTAKRWAINFGVPVVMALLTSVAGWTKTHSDSKEQAGYAKNTAEAGYQGVDKWVTHFKETDDVLLQRIAAVEAELAEVRRRGKLSAGKRKAEAAVRPQPPAPAAVPSPPPPPPPLAPTLDKALEQIQQQQKAPDKPAETAPPPK